MPENQSTEFCTAQFWLTTGPPSGPPVSHHRSHILTLSEVSPTGQPPVLPTDSSQSQEPSWSRKKFASSEKHLRDCNLYNVQTFYVWRRRALPCKIRNRAHWAGLMATAALHEGSPEHKQRAPCRLPRSASQVVVHVEKHSLAELVECKGTESVCADTREAYFLCWNQIFFSLNCTGVCSKHFIIQVSDFQFILQSSLLPVTK